MLGVSVAVPPSVKFSPGSELLMKLLRVPLLTLTSCIEKSTDSEKLKVIVEVSFLKIFCGNADTDTVGSFGEVDGGGGAGVGASSGIKVTPVILVIDNTQSSSSPPLTLLQLSTKRTRRVADPSSSIFALLVS